MKNLVFIVSYNSCDQIIKIIEKINKIKEFKNYDIYLSDDKSTDKTKSFLKKINKKKINSNKITISYNKKNLGYGGNIKKCIEFAKKNKYKNIAMLHGDDQYDPIYIPKLFNTLKKKNICAITGSRMKKKYLALSGNMPIYKFIGNIVLTFIFNYIFKTNFTDCHTGLWAYKTYYLKKINFKKIDNGYNFDSQLRISLLLKKFIIKEIPIKTSYKDEKSSFHIKYSLNFFLDIFFYRNK